MKKNIDRKNLTYLYVILNFLIILLALFIINKPINYKSMGIVFISYICYYILNIFNMNYLRYDIKQVLVCIVINTFLFFISTLIFFRQNEAIIFFGLIILYQIVAKYLMLNYSKVRPRLLFIGENEYKKEIKEEVIKSKLYNIVLDITESEKIENLIDYIEKYNIGSGNWGTRFQ